MVEQRIANARTLILDGVIATVRTLRDCSDKHHAMDEAERVLAAWRRQRVL